MARFEPFAGIRYNPDVVDINVATAPPYDVISDLDRTNLEQLSPYNAVRVELPRDEPGRDRYEAARCTFDDWLAAKVLIADSEPAFYGYSMRFTDEAGGERITTGVVGALGLEPPGGGVLPHENTMPKPKGDRLDLLRRCQANLSPIWALSPQPGLTDAVAWDDARVRSACTDESGAVHELWRIDDAARAEAIVRVIGGGPVLIADGHHRYETAVAYQEEQRTVNGDAAGDYDLVMTFVVELTDEQLAVGAIHRLLSGLPPGFDFVGALSEWFSVTPQGGEGLTLVLPDSSYTLVPLPATLAAAEHALDSSVLDVARAGLPPHDVTYQHGADNIRRAVASGDAQAGLLLRPARVDQIAETSRSGVRMPPKTTFFYPKLRTGLVFRRFTY